MSTDSGFEKYVMLRFTSREDLQNFQEKIGGGSLVSVSDEPQNQSENDESECSGSMWSELGLENYDEKPVEHPPRGKGRESKW